MESETEALVADLDSNASDAETSEKDLELHDLPVPTKPPTTTVAQ